jgi:hypothetical protein
MVEELRDYKQLAQTAENDRVTVFCMVLVQVEGGNHQFQKRNAMLAHTFAFITPAMTDKYNIPNPCTSCHVGKTNA